MTTHGFIGTGVIGTMLMNRFKGKTIISSNKPETNPEVIKQSDIVYLCVRPQHLEDVYQDLQGNLEGKLLVTAIAAVECASYYKQLGDIPLIRITPSLTNIIHGSILAHSGVFVTLANRAQMYNRLARIATLYEVSEKEMDAYAHLSSCSPAVIAAFVREYIRSVNGIDEKKGTDIMVDALLNTALLLKQDGYKIIDQVCTREGISRVGADFVSTFPMQSLSDALHERMQYVKERFG